MEPLRLALALDDPSREAALLAVFERAEPPFRVAGRACAVVQLAASVRELEAVVAGTEADVVIAAATLNAVPFATLRELAGAGRPLVVLAPDPTATRWEGFPAPVLPADPDAAALLEALTTALRGGASQRIRRRPATPALPDRSGAASGEVLAVASGYAGEGKTTVAAGLGFTLGSVAPTVLVDADGRGGAVEFHLGADPARGLCLLDAPAAEDWAAALERELQPMGAPAPHGRVLCGVTKPTLRPRLTPALFEQAVAVLRARARFVVLDTAGAGWTADDPAVDRLALRLADRLLLVLRPDTQGVMRARRALETWPDRERVQLVLNQAGLPGQHARAEIEAALGAPVAAVLPADARGVAAARARHRPVVCQPGCRLAGPLLDLAGRLQGGGPLALAPDPEPAERRTWWRRLAVGLAGAVR